MIFLSALTVGLIGECRFPFFHFPGPLRPVAHAHSARPRVPGVDQPKLAEWCTGGESASKGQSAILTHHLVDVSSQLAKQSDWLICFPLGSIRGSWPRSANNRQKTTWLPETCINRPDTRGRVSVGIRGPELRSMVSWGRAGPSHPKPRSMDRRDVHQGTGVWKSRHPSQLPRGLRVLVAENSLQVPVDPEVAFFILAVKKMVLAW